MASGQEKRGPVRAASSAQSSRPPLSQSLNIRYPGETQACPLGPAALPTPNQDTSTASQPIRAESLPRKALQPRPDKPGHTAESLTDPQSEQSSSSESHQSEHTSPSSATNQGIPGPRPSERGLLTEPLQNLLGIGLLAERLEFFGKPQGATEDGNEGSTSISRPPRLLELLEVLELLH